MQAYPRRRPIRDFLRGRITLRELRVMIEHLPPDSPIHRTVHGPWRDVEGLLWDISTQLRDLIALTYNVNRAKDAAPIEASHLPRPEPTEYQHQADSGSAAERHDLLRVLSRPGGTR